MARKSKTRSRRYKAPARRRRAAPAVKRSAKASAVKSRRRAKKNPKGFFAQPAVKFSIAATVGAGLSTAINSRDDLRFMKSPGNPGYSGSYAAAALTIAVSQFFLKGRNKQYGYALGVGMLLPAVGPALGDAVNKLLPAKGASANSKGAISAGTTTSAYTALPQYRAPAMPSAKLQAVQNTTSRMKSA